MSVMSINLARGIRQERRQLGTKAAVLNGNRFDRIVNEVYAGRSPKMETVARNASNLRVRWIAVPSARWDSGKSFKATAILENTAITCFW